MKIWRLAAVAVLVGGSAACSDDPVAPPAQRSAPEEAPLHSRDASRTIPDRYIVVFKREVNDAPGLARSLAAGHGGSIHFTYQHALKGFAATLPAAAVQAIRRNPGVAYVEPDKLVDALATVQPYATWGLDRIDQREQPLNSTYTYKGNGAGVNVYVIDSGLSTAHPEFGGRARNVYDTYGGTGQDCNGHGTHVAGTVGGTTYGVAKGVTLHGLRVVDCAGSGEVSRAISAVDWVASNHAKPAVANMSLRYPASPALDQAVRNSIGAGVTYTIAAGNDNIDACTRSPAAVREAIVVGATDQTDTRAYFSSYGDCLDLFAPGVGVTSAWLNNGTRIIDGTSMAAPHAAGVAALYLQENPGYSPALVRDRMFYNSTVWAVQDAGPGSPPHVLLSWPGIRQRVAFRTDDGIHYLQAENEGGAGVNATPSWIGAWEQFWLMDLNGGELQHGDPVNIKSGNDEWFLAAQWAGGAGVDAVQRHGHGWERFTIEREGGATGPIGNGARIHLRAYNPYYVSADWAGGSAVKADKQWAYGWETFTLVFQ